MIPAVINGFVGDLAITHCSNRKYRGQLVMERLELSIDQNQPPSWQVQTLVHEMTHLAFALCHGIIDDGDDREEPACTAIGRLLPKVLMDNPGLLDPIAELRQVDIIGEIWNVEYMEEPSEEDLGTVAWRHTSSQTLRCREELPLQLRRLRLFQLVCEAVLLIGGVAEPSNTYYWSMSAMLYALLRANPGVHTKAVVI